MTQPRFNFSVVDSSLTLKPLGPDKPIADAWWEVVEHNRQMWSETSTYANNQCATYDDMVASLTREAEQVKTGERFNRGIWVDGQLRGRILVKPDQANRSAEIGFAVDARVQGRGVATRAARYMVQHLLQEQGFVRVWLTCLPDNVGSIKVAEALRMQLEGRLRSAKIINGAPHDKLLYAIVP